MEVSYTSRLFIYFRGISKNSFNYNNMRVLNSIRVIWCQHDRAKILENRNTIKAGWHPISPRQYRGSPQLQHDGSAEFKWKGFISFSMSRERVSAQSLRPWPQRCTLVWVIQSRFAAVELPSSTVESPSSKCTRWGLALEHQSSSRMETRYWLNFILLSVTSNFKIRWTRNFAAFAAKMWFPTPTLTS